MEVIIVPVERYRDGKLHPAGGRLRGVEWNRAVNLAHRLRCRDHLPYREIVRAMEQYGIRRSLGQVFSDVHTYQCPSCAGQRPGQA